MASYAALIAPLSIAGSRLTDGTANASGTVWFFQPGTNTQVNVYSDAAATTVVTQPITLGAGGKLPSQYSGGVFATQPIRLFIQDASGNIVSDTVYIPATAGDVGVNNPGFSNATLDQVLTTAFTSFGGQDFQYLIATGQTSRSVGAVITELSVSVKSFGAKGDGIAIDTTAIQNAINFVVAAGGGVVYLPPGTYVVDQALTHTSANGVRIVGAGNRSTIIQFTHATANLFTFTTPTNCSIENIRILHTSSSTGAVAAVSGATDFFALNINQATASFAFGLDFSGSSNWFVDFCQLKGTTRTIRSNTSGSGRPSSLTRSILSSGATASIEINGNQGSYFIGSTQIPGTTGILINSAYTGTGIRIHGNSFSATTAISTSGLATLNDFRQWGNGLASATSGATGSSQTPILTNGNQVMLTAASGGAGTVTVNAPATLPGTGSANDDLFWDFVFINAAGGAVTWSLNAVFVVNTAIPTTAAHTILVRFWWDRANSKLREVARADTAT